MDGLERKYGDLLRPTALLEAGKRTKDSYRERRYLERSEADDKRTVMRVEQTDSRLGISEHLIGIELRDKWTDRQTDRRGSSKGLAFREHFDVSGR